MQTVLANQVEDTPMEHWATALLRNLQRGNIKSTATVDQQINRIIKIIDDTGVHHFRTDELEKLADEVVECADLVQLAQLLWLSATSCGFEHFVMFVITQGSKGAFSTRVTTSFNEEWIARYEKMNYSSIDPIFNAATSWDRPFSFAEVSRSSPAIELFWEDAVKHRVGENGICFPITRNDGSKLAVSYITRKSALLAARCIEQNGCDLGFISELATECFCFLSQGQHRSDRILSLEELRFLHALSTDRDPTRALAMTASFGSNKSLQTSIRQKLGVETIFQAVSIASWNHWFDSLPYEQGEVVLSHPKLSGFDLFSVGGKALD